MVNRLVTVVGGSPQTVTETLFVLEQQDPRCRVDCIDLIATGHNHETIRTTLQRKLEEYEQEYSAKTAPHPCQWNVLTDQDGNTIQDVLTTEDSNQIGKQIFEVVRRVTANPSTRILASIAGGRKTMSYYLGLAMSVFARPQDRLFHVLVPPDVESNREFYYPHYGEESLIQLPELPFARLRGFMERKLPELYEASDSFDALIAAANQQLGPALPGEFTLVVDLNRNELSIPELTSVGPLKLERRLIKLFETIQLLDDTPRELTALEEGGHQADPNFKDYLSELNRKLEQHFGYRTRIQSEPAHRSRKARYFLSRGMRIACIS